MKDYEQIISTLLTKIAELENSPKATGPENRRLRKTLE
jgi:hypothetical protein